jgi:PST family polysaccharide transporter
MAMSLASRALGVAGTLTLTYFLDRHVVGEVANAAIIVASAVQVALLGVPQYLVTRRTLDRSTAWHASVVIVGGAVLALALVVAFGKTMCVWLKAPGMWAYLPGLALASLLTTIAVVPERLAQRTLRFREVSFVRGARDVSYTVSSVALAAGGLGGMAMVGGNLLRGSVHLGLSIRLTPWRQWLTPHRLSLATFRQILRFGLPVMVALICGTAARSWDNLVISGFYGASAAGAYNLAYNLADIPAVQIGEQITDVLMPSLAQLEPEQRKAALVRSTSFVCLLVFPLAAGLGTVAPTLVATFLRPEWSQVGPMLAVLSALAIVRPVGWAAGTYLAASNRPRAVMWLSILNLAALFGAMSVLGRLGGPLWACAGVGIGFGIHAAASVITVSRYDGIPVMSFLKPVVPPLVACAVMVVAVLGARALLSAIGSQWRFLNLSVEVFTGGCAYLAAVALVARPTVAQLVALLKQTSRAHREVSGS